MITGTLYKIAGFLNTVNQKVCQIDNIMNEQEYTGLISFVSKQ